MLRRILANSTLFRLVPIKRLSSAKPPPGTEPSLNEYHEASDRKLEELSDKLEDYLEDHYDKGADVSLNNGVLTVVVDSQNTYVINKQTPNRQIWLSSPLSGPMRFDLVEGKWINKHDEQELGSVLSNELSELLKNNVQV